MSDKPEIIKGDDPAASSSFRRSDQMSAPLTGHARRVAGSAAGQSPQSKLHERLGTSGMPVS
jgi:hypothetical protein